MMHSSARLVFAFVVAHHALALQPATLFKRTLAPAPPAGFQWADESSWTSVGIVVPTKKPRPLKKLSPLKNPTQTSTVPTTVASARPIRIDFAALMNKLELVTILMASKVIGSISV